MSCYSYHRRQGRGHSCHCGRHCDLWKANDHTLAGPALLLDALVSGLLAAACRLTQDEKHLRHVRRERERERPHLAEPGVSLAFLHVHLVGVDGELGGVEPGLLAGGAAPERGRVLLVGRQPVGPP